jgi:hypothetical protein
MARRLRIKGGFWFHLMMVFLTGGLWLLWMAWKFIRA